MWSWPLACVVGGLLAGLTAMRLLLEAQRCRTLLELVQLAPAGTLVVVTETSEAPAVWVQIGHGSSLTGARSLHDTPHP